MGRWLTAWCLYSEMAAKSGLTIASPLKIRAGLSRMSTSTCIVLGMKQVLCETASTK